MIFCITKGGSRGHKVWMMMMKAARLVCRMLFFYKHDGAVKNFIDLQEDVAYLQT